MNSFKRILAAGLALALAGTAPSLAQNASLPDSVRSAGVLRVGIEATYPPMAYKDPATNERRGVNVDLVTAIARDLGMEIRWEEMSFEQIINSLTTGRIDFSGTSMTDLPARREKLSFVDYITTGGQLFTTRALAASIREATDFCGKSVSTPRFTNYFPSAQAWSERACVGAGRPAMQVMGSNGATASRTDLRQERTQGAILGAEFVAHLQRTEPENWAAVGRPITDNLSGLAFPKEATALRDAIAASLQRLIDNGTYGEILRKHGIEAQALQRVSIDAGQP
ncbi:transporter substrate-binding domain-containing protein [Pseudoroseomonas cervicalis]|uniref:ABC transporter, substrate-binding protein, family 3 n=1 Tax=Pseudoroseomonas cervicalis ATCC 49957 TaxID=525371 RepID=D5RMC7_9PROT|nr:transporter substrate-binding domain-containing protein [Pseudoroseomonas cervicalis]EFH11541.1 ABC transporter, substrate-binding protein, family 3 [Pseudoroseomonas cervicalis ATCC 49957]